MADAIPPGLQAIFVEMERQSADAAASFEQTGQVAAMVADSMRRSGRVLLLGMGGSHAVNRMAEGLYRRAGLDATALPVSEALYAPFAAGGRTVLLASQSGESGEIVRYLDIPAADGEERFGLTLNAAGTLARSVPSLVGHGGMERAFAATRSLTVSVALHARILHELGVPQEEAFAALDASPPDIGAAADVLAAKTAVVFSGRAAMQGVAEAGALGLMELARIPCFALEGGQLRHGPVEALRPDLGVVLVRAEGAVPELAAGMAELCIEAGSPPVIMDASGLPAIPGAITVALPRSADFAAAFRILLALQALMIEVARRRVADVGTPVRSTKVTRDE